MFVYTCVYTYMSFAIHDIWKAQKLSKMGQITLNVFLNLTKLIFQTVYFFIKLFLFLCSITFTKVQISKLIEEHKPFSANI